MTTKPTAHVSEYKKKLNKELVELLDSKNTIMIASIKSLPSAQFQKIKKSLVGEAEVRVVKKRAMLRALDECKKDEIKKLKDFVHEDIAILMSDTGLFELAGKLDKNKSPVRAKTGQEAIEDVEIEAGVTDLPAGPAVSELGSLGLTVKVKDGKIEIIKTKVIVAKGKVISEVAAGVMGKLDILPFSVGFIPLVAYDSESGKIYETLVMDKEQLVTDLKTLYAKANSFAVSVGFICKESVVQMIGVAKAEAGKLEGFVGDKPVEEAVEEKVEEPKEDAQNKTQEEI